MSIHLHLCVYIYFYRYLYLFGVVSLCLLITSTSICTPVISHHLSLYLCPSLHLCICLCVSTYLYFLQLTTISHLTLWTSVFYFSSAKVTSCGTSFRTKMSTSFYCLVSVTRTVWRHLASRHRNNQSRGSHLERTWNASVTLVRKMLRVSAKRQLLCEVLCALGLPLYRTRLIHNSRVLL